jgi:two-component system, OmpR family, KDP operon response regulator KdpE
MTRVLVVDDDPQLLRALKINLAARGYTVLTAPDGTRALHVAAHDHPDVIVLDLGLPDLDGSDVITGLRGWSTTPIIVLSARTDSGDKVEALDAGADDYVTKPFGMDELVARLRAAVRRAATHATGGEPVVHAGSLDIDLAAKQVTRDGAVVHLTPTEWGILELLVRHQGKLVT